MKTETSNMSIHKIYIKCPSLIDMPKILYFERLFLWKFLATLGMKIQCKAIYITIISSLKTFLHCDMLLIKICLVIRNIKNYNLLKKSTQVASFKVGKERVYLIEFGYTEWIK